MCIRDSPCATLIPASSLVGAGVMGAEAGGQEFVIFRVLDAPRERVWQALTDPECMKDWWTPGHFTMIAMNMDFRPGGSFHLGMRSAEGYKMLSLIHI